MVPGKQMRCALGNGIKPRCTVEIDDQAIYKLHDASSVSPLVTGN